MDGKLWRVFVLLALTGCAGRPAPAATPAGCATSPEVERLAAEFRRLRAEQGHYQGGPWNAELDAWGGRKQQVMIELGLRLGSGGCPIAQVVWLLGPPDSTARQGDTLFELVARTPEFSPPPSGSFELLVYYWRGAHDLLYFVAQGEAVVGSGWWYAYE